MTCLTKDRLWFGEDERRSDLRRRITRLREELAALTDACDKAREQQRPGYLFFLLRKKWTLTQHLFQAENKLLVETDPMRLVEPQ